MNTLAELENLIRVVAKRLKNHSEATGASTVSGAIEIHGVSGTVAATADITTHAGLTTGVHGVGASTVESATGSQAKVDTHAALTATHGATGAIVGTTNEQTLTLKTLTTPVIATLYQDAAKTKLLTFPAVSDTVVTLDATQTLTAKTLTSPTINGTIGTTGLTMPAFSIGDTITFTADGAIIARSVDTGYVIFRGGTNAAGKGAYFALGGKDFAGAGGLFIFSTPNAAYDADVERLRIVGGAATVVATWAAITHTGMVLTSPTINGTIATTSSLTLPTHISGAIAFNVDAIVLSRNSTDAGYIQWVGGTDGNSAKITLTGKSKVGDPGRFYVGTPNAALTYIDRITMTGAVDIAQLSWTNCKHVFDAASLPNGDPSVSGQLYYLAADGIVRRSA